MQPQKGAYFMSSPDSAAAEPKTFASLVSALARADDDLSDPNFDPALLLSDIRDKVDAIHFVLERMDAVSAWLKDIAAPFLSKSKTITSNHARLRSYVVHVMQQNQFHALPGEKVKVTLMNSPPSLVMEREASSLDYQAYPEYVQIERRYKWNTEKIKEDLLKGKELPEIPGRITQGQYPRFHPIVPEKLESKKQKKAIKGDSK
jgi:hypothetical protein